MQQLINDLLSFSRVSTRQNPFQTVDLNETLQAVLSDLEILIQDHQARIVVKHLPTIEADPTQMRQLFQNLISNAIKFRREETPEITIESSLYTSYQQQSREHDMVEITVADNGIGFEEKYLDRIFHIFQRLDGRKFEGSGIGLAICRRIASKHGGNITASSEPG
ncbi:MAG: hypothetical protein KDA75_23480, partial [Planctomycetaceae bacterium]|nr:hypothetical protein [Planctomycetaceae bacterium]